jgi:hypothetical protein
MPITDLMRDRISWFLIRRGFMPHLTRMRHYLQARADRRFALKMTALHYPGRLEVVRQRLDDDLGSACVFASVLRERLEAMG